MNTPETTAERILVVLWKDGRLARLLADGYGFTVADLQTLAREYLRGRWIDVSERLPDDSRTVLVTTSLGDVGEMFYSQIHGFHHLRENAKVIAWRERPSPYQPPDPFAEECPTTCGCLPGEDHDEERGCGV